MPCPPETLLILTENSWSKHNATYLLKTCLCAEKKMYSGKKVYFSLMQSSWHEEKEGTRKNKEL